MRTLILEWPAQMVTKAIITATICFIVCFSLILVLV
jgi:hypothetical protein